MLDMQRRIDELASAVQRLEQRYDDPPSHPSSTAAATTASQQQQPRVVLRERNIVRPAPPAVQQRAAAAPEPRRGIPIVTPLYFFLTGIPTRLRASRVGQMTRVWFIMRRHYVLPNNHAFNGMAILQIMFVSAVLYSQLGNYGAYKTMGFIAILVLGYLMRAGYFTLLTVIWKEGYFQRIWNGEEMNWEELERPRPPVLPRAAAGQHRGGGWNVFVGIPQPAQERQVGVLSVLQDFLYLLASFVLSIFPMWRPELPPPPANNQGDPQQQAPQPPVVPAAGDLGAIPEVRPPPDAMAPAEDEDDDNNNNRDEPR